MVGHHVGRPRLASQNPPVQTDKNCSAGSAITSVLPLCRRAPMGPLGPRALRRLLALLPLAALSRLCCAQPVFTCPPGGGAVHTGSAGSGSFAYTGGEAVAQSPCVWVIGSPSARTLLYNMSAVGDPTSGSLLVYGAIVCCILLRFVTPHCGVWILTCTLTYADGAVPDPAALVLRIQGCD